jgi:cation diffusion facilitator CzcD-associated flavoprotein CzcO
MTEPNESEVKLNFDPEALHRKYLEERDRRLRNEGNAQYVDVSGELADYADDPYVEPGFSRDPITDEVDVVVLGGGFAGLLTSAQLREAGVDNIRIIEQAGDFGGTWYWNRYPGIRCDVESYIYMPLLEKIGTIPTQKYAEGAEIFAHCQAIGRHYGLYADALFQTKLNSVCWDESISRWIVRTNRNDEIKARFVVAANGSINRPKLPGIPGIQNFKGHAFHTSRWDYSYTGGNSTGNLTKLIGKRVAVIGAGATAIQIVPPLGEFAEHLFVFQRTPSAVDARDNKPTDRDWFRTQKPGWQQRRMDNFVAILFGIPQEEDLVNDRWTDAWSKFSSLPKAADETIDPAALIQLVDYQKMEDIRARIDEIVRDPKVAESLKPWYNLFCKRPLYSDEFLQTFNRPNVTLVDTQGRGVERITESALVFDGKAYEIDCLVYATGFRAGAYLFEGGDYEVFGRDGLSLSKKWAKGVRSLHGIHSRGFPNFFIVGGYAQASAAANYSHVVAPQATYVAAVIKHGLARKTKVMEVSQEAEDNWARKMAEKYVDRSKFEAECTPGYYNNEGNTKDRPSLWSSMYGGGPMEYIEICNEWHASHIEKDMDLTFE